MKTFLESAAADFVQNGALDDLRTFKYRIEDVTFKHEADVFENFLYFCLRTWQIKVLLTYAKTSKLFGEQQLNSSCLIGIVLNKLKSTLGSATLCILGLGIS